MTELTMSMGESAVTTSPPPSSQILFTASYIYRLDVDTKPVVTCFGQYLQYNITTGLMIPAFLSVG